MKRVLAGAIAWVGLGCGSPAAAPPTSDAGADRTDAPAPTIASLADTLALDEIAFQRTVKVTVMKADWPTRPNAPLIEGRKGIARVFLRSVTKNRRFQARALEAELHVIRADGESVLRDARKIAGPSEETDLESTFDFAYDATFLSGAQRYWVVVRDAAATARGERGATLRWPDSGSNLLPLEPNPGRVHVRIVPIAYGADASNRLPDTSDARIAKMTTVLYDRFPTSEVTIDVRRDPLSWPDAVDPNGEGWGPLLQEVMAVRAKDAPPDDVYYVGAFDPRPSYPAYCPSGCIAGLAPTAQPASPGLRAVLVLGFGGDVLDDTLPHELGHVMGRMHAPCGNPGYPDPQYPYSSGSSGVTGWRASDERFVFESSDVMSYCLPGWISDYTYSALAERIRTVNAQGAEVGVRAPSTVQRLLVDARGALSWGHELKLSEVSGGDDVEVVYRDANGGTVAKRTGHRWGYDHVAGGFVLVADPPTTRWSSVTLPTLSATLAL